MGYSFYRPVTIDQVTGASALTNFTILFKETETYFATVGNGGKVQHGSGFDIAFFSDSALTVPLKFERTLYTASSGACTFWVKVPSVSHSSTTLIYVAYGDASISSDQQDAVNAWDSNYKLVAHLDDNAANTTVVDSKGAHNGTLSVNTDTRDVAGKVNGGLHLQEAATATVINFGDHADFNMGTGFTYEFWVKTSTTGKIAGGRWDGSTVKGYFWYFDGSWYVADDAVPAFHTVANGQTSDDQWHLFALVWDGTDLTSYKDGQQVAQTGLSGVTDQTGRALFLGSSGSGSELTGDYDEVRYSRTGRSPGWIEADFNSQNTGFYSIGTEVDQSATPLTQPVSDNANPFTPA